MRAALHGQAWAQLEESCGALERADELRNFRMHERVEIVAPRVFAGAGSVLSPILDQLAAWFDKMEAAQRPEQRTAPRLLPVSDKPRQLLSISGQLEDLFDMEEVQRANSEELDI